MFINTLRIVFCASLMTGACLKAESSETTDSFMERNILLLSGEMTPSEEERISNEERSAFDENAYSEESLVFERSYKKQKSFLFERINGTTHHGQDLDKSMNVYEELVAHSLPTIVFKEEKLYPFDHRGTCSAMALDFLARYFSTCRGCVDHEDAISAQIAKFNTYYEVPTSTIISRQAAYNTITVEDNEDLEVEEIKFRKMQSLANYHNIKLTPQTESMSLNDIVDGQIDFKKVISDLPQGSYVIRALSPTDNDKQEWYGHTMILIKKKGFSIFFDNAKGAAKITEETDIELGEHLEETMLNWRIPEYRIYRARIGAGGCRNLSLEEVSDLQCPDIL